MPVQTTPAGGCDRRPSEPHAAAAHVADHVDHLPRTIYAGDYPILLQSTSIPEWVQVLDNAFADLGLSEAETRKIYRDNAIKFYRLDL